MSYCTYLTTYKGSKMPPFYIGYSTVDKVGSGYRGSVSSEEYRGVWKQEISANPDLFKTTIISTHPSRLEALHKENSLQKSLKVIKNPLYINKATAYGYHSNDGEKQAREKQSKTLSKVMSDPDWKASTGKVRAERISLTRQSEEWQNTKKKKMVEALNACYQNEYWRNTKWKEACEKRKATRSNPVWQQTVWAEQNKKSSEKKLSAEWKEAVGNEAYKKVSKAVKETMNTREWKDKNYKTCPHCEVRTNPGNYAKHHGDKCKTLSGVK